MNTKWKKLYFPLFWEVAFIIGTRLWSIYALYLYFLFFWGFWSLIRIVSLCERGFLRLEAGRNSGFRFS